MDLATVIGLIGAWALIIATMVLGGSGPMFVNIPSLVIVIGGSMMVVMIKFGMGQFFAAIKSAGKAFMCKVDRPEELIDQVVELADLARKGGLLSLEGKQVDNTFLQNGIQLLVDGHDPEVVKTLLTKDMRQTVDRHDWGQKVWSSIGDVGPAMAVALLTTLYGAMMATMLAIPIADKLNLRSSEEERIKSLVIDALLAIQAGQNPRVIDTMLRTYLPSTKRGSPEEE